MAGKRHHFLPRFLLSGFASKVQKNEAYCWVYRKAGQHFEANITKVGVEKFFYGDLDNDFADSVITDAEPKYAEFLNELRSSSVDRPVDPLLAAEFTVHLAVRNRNLREDVSSTVETLFEGIKEKVSDTKILRQLVINYLNDNPKELERMFRKNVLQGVQLPRSQYKIKLAQHRLLIPSLINSAPESTLREIANTLGAFEDRLRPSIKDGHNKAIAKNHAPLKRIEAISNLEWKIHDFGANSLILGDFGAYAIRNDDQSPCSLIYAEDNVDVVVLPISHQRLLVGKNTSSKYSLKPKEVNQYSASISRQFFVSSISADERIHFVSLIGTIIPTELDEAAAKSLAEL